MLIIWTRSITIVHKSTNKLLEVQYRSNFQLYSSLTRNFKTVVVKWNEYLTANTLARKASAWQTYVCWFLSPPVS